jgi:hypothetical protein
MALAFLTLIRMGFTVVNAASNAGSLPWALVWGSARHHQCRTQFIFKNIPNVIRFDALRLHVFWIVRF